MSIHHRHRRPAVLVSATHSGAGKTTATAVLIAALRERGLTVQPFKVGPDFIDTAYLAEAAGRPAVNLDLWMMGEAGVDESFARWSATADVAVIEGMGALFDGQDGTGRGSAAHLATLLGVPVLVVLDVWGMTRTAGAILRGLIDFDPDVAVAGCLLNQVGSGPHARMVIDALPPDLQPLVVGHLPRLAGLRIPERHLGLLTARENTDDADTRRAALREGAAGIDVDLLLRMADRLADHEVPAAPDSVAATSATPTPTRFPDAPRPRLAVADDAAFCFYYAENLLLLEHVGIELTRFSPLAGDRLPDGADGVYLGGGYPESFAAELAGNTALAADLRAAAADGLPIYAECGGLLYLARSLTGFDGERHTMAGVLDIDATMDAAYLAISYVTARTRAPSLLGPAGTVLRGQEFHQSRLRQMEPTGRPNLFDVTTSDGRTTTAGFQRGSVLASYLHLHFASNTETASRLRHALSGGGTDSDRPLPRRCGPGPAPVAAE